MADLGESLERMSFVQLLLLLGFVAAYMLALGAMLGSRWRRRVALAAAVLAAGFTANTDPWVHGALLVVFVVAGLGLFVGASWLMARLFGPHEAIPVAAGGELPETTPPDTAAPAGDSQPMSSRPPKAPKLATRRVLR